MKVVMVLNYLSIHQKALADEFYKQLGSDFSFISSFKPQGYKTKLGNFEYEPYVIRAYEDRKNYLLASQKIIDADICITGSGDETLLKKRKKIIFRMSERIFRKTTDIINPKSLLRLIHIHYIYRENDKYGSYLLCNSFQSKRDFGLAQLFKNHSRKFGYFPRALVDEKFIKPNNAKLIILWAGRCAKLKHPELIFAAAKELTNNHVAYEIRFVSPSSKELDNFLDKYKRQLKKYPVIVLKNRNNEDTLEEMKRADVFLFTSGVGEGFGATLYESMSAACCPIANIHAGATKLLIQNGTTGYTYKTKKDFLKIIKQLKNNRTVIKQIGMNAKKFIAEKYNYKVAVKNIIEFYNSGYTADFPFDEPMAKY